MEESELNVQGAHSEILKILLRNIFEPMVNGEGIHDVDCIFHCVCRFFLRKYFCTFYSCRILSLIQYTMAHLSQYRTFLCTLCFLVFLGFLKKRSKNHQKRS